MRIFRFAGLLVLAGSMASAQVAAPASPIPADVLRPTGPWKLDYAPSECRLLRDFGTGDAQTTLQMVRGSGFNQFDAVIAGKSVPKLKDRVTVDMAMIPQNLVDHFDGISAQIPGHSERFVRWSDADFTALSSATDAQQIQFKAEGGLQISLLLNGGKAAVEALNKCYDQLLADWGVTSVEKAALGNLSVPATPKGAGQSSAVLAQRIDRPTQKVTPGSWVTPMDYPTEALRQEISGKVVMLTGLNSAGRVENCRVIKSSKFEPLDQKSCEVMTKRAQYAPPQHAGPSAVISRIVWMIPKD